MKVHWPKLMAALLGAVAFVFLLTGLIDWRGVRPWMQHLDPWVLLALMCLLPLFGFSISVVYLVAGAVFGGPLGVVVIAGVSAVHLLGNHWIGRGYLRGPILRWLKRRNLSPPALPLGEDASVALMTALVPGLPYFVRNYLLAVSDLRFRTSFWIVWSVYVVRSSVVLFFGDFIDDLTTIHLVTLLAVFGMKLSICACLLFRIRAHLRQNKGRTLRTALQQRLARAAYADR